MATKVVVYRRKLCKEFNKLNQQIQSHNAGVYYRRITEIEVNAWRWLLINHSNLPGYERDDLPEAVKVEISFAVMQDLFDGFVVFEDHRPIRRFGYSRHRQEAVVIGYRFRPRSEEILFYLVAGWTKNCKPTKPSKAIHYYLERNSILAVSRGNFASTGS